MEICRREMGEPELVVEVHCFMNAWKTDDESGDDGKSDGDAESATDAR